MGDNLEEKFKRLVYSIGWAKEESTAYTILLDYTRVIQFNE